MALLIIPYHCHQFIAAYFYLFEVERKRHIFCNCQYVTVTRNPGRNCVTCFFRYKHIHGLHRSYENFYASPDAMCRRQFLIAKIMLTIKTTAWFLHEGLKDEGTGRSMLLLGNYSVTVTSNSLPAISRFIRPSSCYHVH